jgi:hypothetical protein
MLKPRNIVLWTGLLALALVAFWPSRNAEAAASYPPRNGDPCSINMRIAVPVNLAASGLVATGAAAKQTYVCHIALVSATAQNVALVEGTGAVCAGGTAGMAGGATAATGWNFFLGEELVEGVGGNWVLATATAGDNVCLLSSSTGQISGVVDYVQQ